MAPTEILAEQHAHTILRSTYNLTGWTSVSLTGSMTAREKREALGMVQMGLAHVVVGTHALIQESVHFHRLGLVITDEQHRFGVNQRAKLREKGEDPDVLFMTATPIPAHPRRISAYGDMDVSTIDQLPAGRKPVKTVQVKPNQFGSVMEFIHKECRRGRQAYATYPLD